MKNLLKMSLILIVMISMSSCFKQENKVQENKVAGDEEVFGTHGGEWIVVKQNGGIITDVWLLEHQWIQNESSSFGGWVFRDKHKNQIHVDRDVKLIRLNNNKDKLLDMYLEYHMEFDSLTYYQRLMASKR